MITLEQIKSACADCDYDALHGYHARMRMGTTLELCEAEATRVHMHLNIKLTALNQDPINNRQLISACDALLRGAAHPCDDQQHSALIEADAIVATMQLSPYMDKPV